MPDRECDVFFNFNEDSIKKNLLNKLILSNCNLLFVIHLYSIIYKVCQYRSDFS
jgi:hypothetical protein